MTQAYNLAILANAVNSSGQLNVGTNATGTLPVANGGTGTSSPSLVAGSGINITGSFPNQTITNTSSATGTVTSVATGNGLSGGTITTSGTLIIACPSTTSVGSYTLGWIFGGGGVGTGGSKAGSQIQYADGAGTPRGVTINTGTWRNMAGSISDNEATLFCRIS